MKYLNSFKSFNEGLFTTNETDDQIASEILDKLSKMYFDIKLIDKHKYLATDLKLDDNPGTYNITSNFFEVSIEYYNDDKIKFKQTLKCNTNFRKQIYDILQDKYLAENNI